MKYEHNYEWAFHYYRPGYLVTGRKNNSQYTITGEYTNGDLFREHADNKEDVDHVLNLLRNRAEVRPDTIAMQNVYGQLMWNSETGFNGGGHPKYMDRMECMKTSFWSDVSKF